MKKPKQNIYNPFILGLIGGILGIIIAYSSNTGLFWKFLVEFFSVLGIIGSIIFKYVKSPTPGSILMIFSGAIGILLGLTFSISLYVLPGVVLIMAGIIGLKKWK